MSNKTDVQKMIVDIKNEGHYSAADYHSNLGDELRNEEVKLKKHDRNESE